MPHGLDDHGDVAEEGDEGALAHFAREYEVAAPADDDQRGRSGKHRHDRGHHRRDARLRHEGVGVARVVVVEAVDLELLAGHDLEGTYTAEGLLGPIRER